jgi:hypothetical protein
VADWQFYCSLEAFLLHVMAVTYRAWHAGLREQQQQDCYKKASQDVMYKCLDRINSMTSEQYMKAHEDLKQHIQ